MSLHRQFQRISDAGAFLGRGQRRNRTGHMEELLDNEREQQEPNEANQANAPLSQSIHQLLVDNAAGDD
jgi:hypothetical protein